MASSFCLADFDFDLAVLAFGLSGFSALPAFFAALPSRPWPLSAPFGASAVAAGGRHRPRQLDRAPSRRVPRFAAAALVPVGFPWSPVFAARPPGTALVPVFAAVALAAAPTVAALRAVDRVAVLPAADWARAAG